MSTMMSTNTSAPSGTFVPTEFFGMIQNLSRGDIDSCDFGVIQLDDQGNCVMANRYQAELAGLSTSAYDGKHWFTRIAPCTNNSLIYGTFKKGVAAGQLNVMIPYTFTFKMRPTNVKLHLFRDQASGKNFAFCVRA